MSVVYKYPLKIDDVQVLNLPGEYQILHVAEQDGQLTLWAIAEPEGDPNYLTIRVLGTGHEFYEGEDFWLHLGTVLMANGLVWHVFEVQ